MTRSIRAPATTTRTAEPGDDEIDQLGAAFGLDDVADGSDIIDGGGDGFDTASYAGRTLPVSLSLDGVRNDGQAGENDNLIAIDDIVGGLANDTLAAGPATTPSRRGSATTPSRAVPARTRSTTPTGRRPSRSSSATGGGRRRGREGHDRSRCRGRHGRLGQRQHHRRRRGQLSRRRGRQRRPRGGAGDDDIDPGDGSDQLDGGAGDDTADYSTITHSLDLPASPPTSRPAS